MKFIVAFFVGVFASIFNDYVRKAFRVHWEAFFLYKLWPRCEHCATIFGLAFEDSRTQYPYEYKDDLFSGKIDPKDPNRSQLLCRQCAVLHHEYWDEMWRDYYSGKL